MVFEKVKHLDEAHARQLLAWFQTQEQATQTNASPMGAHAMLGFARRFRAQIRPTKEWMDELREGERD